MAGCAPPRPAGAPNAGLGVRAALDRLVLVRRHRAEAAPGRLDGRAPGREAAAVAPALEVARPTLVRDIEEGGRHARDLGALSLGFLGTGRVGARLETGGGLANG